MKDIKKWLTYKNFHILSLIAIVCVFIIGAIAYIENDTAYLRVFSNEPLKIGKCFYRDNFGVECPSCGLTRSFISIEDLNFKQAFNYNRIGLFVYILLLGVLILNILGIRESKVTGQFGKFLAVYGFLICIALVVNWVITHFL